MEPLNLTITAGAQVLGVTRQTLNNIVNEKPRISTKMAIRLSTTFGSTPAIRLGLQAAFDLAPTRTTATKIEVQRYRRARAEVAV